MDVLPTAEEAVAQLTEANKAPRCAHLNICITNIMQAIQSGQREASFCSWCLQDADLEPLRAKGYTCSIADQLVKVTW